MGSPNGRKVEAVIHHLKLTVEVEHHDLLSGELRSPAFKAINPNGTIPVLVDGSFVLWESNAIMQYLADKVPGNNLFPREPQPRADVVRWLCWDLAHFNKAFGTLALETYVKPTFNFGPTNDALVAQAITDLARWAPVLEGHLEKRRYLVGDGITLADYSMIRLESYRTRTPFDWQPYPAINAYFDRARVTDSWAKTAPPDPAALGRRPKAA